MNTFYILASMLYLKNPIFTGNCEIIEKIDTNITFIIPKSLYSTYDQNTVDEKLKRFILYSNKVMDNSCIPLIRKLSKIVVVDDKKYWPEDVYAMRSCSITLGHLL